MVRSEPDRPIAAGQTIASGLIAGLIAAVIMAMYAMLAGATYLKSGLFTPMYHIASAVTDPKAMMASMKQAMQGNIFFFQAGPAMVGLALHMMVGAAFGLLFGLIARGLRVRGVAAIVGGILYGLIVMALMSFVGLPAVAGVFGGGKPIADMPQMVGWTTFSIEHALFGLVLGLWFARPGAMVPERVRREEIRAGAA